MSYEKKDVNVSKIVGFTIIIIVFLIAVIVFLNEFFIFEVENIKKERDNVVSTELRDLRATEDETLNSYKVLNADKNKYQIPIERAMKLLADEAYEKRKNEK
jgi:cytoskeletal protein RodZ